VSVTDTNAVMRSRLCRSDASVALKLPTTAVWRDCFVARANDAHDVNAIRCVRTGHQSGGHLCYAPARVARRHPYTPFESCMYIAEGRCCRFICVPFAPGQAYSRLWAFSTLLHLLITRSVKDSEITLILSRYLRSFLKPPISLVPTVGDKLYVAGCKAEPLGRLRGSL